MPAARKDTQPLDEAAMLLGEQWRPMLAALESAPARTVIFAGAEQLLAYQNVASRTLHGVRAVGRPARDVFADLPRFVLALEQVWASGEELRFTQAPVGQPDDVRPHTLVDAVCSPLRNLDGDLVGVFSQAISVTDPAAEDERLRAARALDRVSVELSRSLDVDQVTAAVTRLAAQLFSGWGLLDLWQPDGSLLRIGATHYDPAKQELIDEMKTQPRVSGRPDRQAESYAVQAARNGTTRIGVVDTDALIASATSPRHSELIRRLQPRYFITVPIGREPRRLGALSVVRPHGEEAFDARDRAVLEQFAERAAIALTHAGDYSEQRRAALTLQRSLLPAEPQRSMLGVDLAVRYRAADAGTEVGGDWYDTLLVGSNAMAVVVGDVEGHDLEAAALMGQVRAIVHSHARSGLPPARVAAAANSFVAQAAGDRLVTMSYLQVHPDSRLVTWVRAGHLPTVVVAPGRAPRLLDGRGGLPLGVEELAEWQEETVHLPPHALLAICSDGLVESASRTPDTGLDRVAALLSERLDDDVDVLADALLADLTDGQPRRDDVALVLLRMPGGNVDDRPNIVRRLPALPSSAPIARWFLTDILAAWSVPSDVTETAALLVTELVSNASRQSDAFLDVRLSCTPTVLTVGVYDESHRLPHYSDPGTDDTSGRGLQLVELLSSRWGIETEERGKVVWFSLDMPAG
ncbi:MAG: ATP-binding SpoIIE family protein phosphatase [Acidothermaceae bacterium]